MPLFGPVIRSLRKDVIKALREENERLTRERDEARAKLTRCVEVLELRKVNPKPRMTVREVCEEALAAAKGE